MNLRRNDFLLMGMARTVQGRGRPPAACEDGVECGSGDKHQ